MAIRAFIDIDARYIIYTCIQRIFTFKHTQLCIIYYT